MDDLTSFRRDILIVIGGLGAPHGLAIQSELEDYYEGAVDHGRLYPNLNTLVEQGLVDKSARDDRSNEYRLTQTGTRRLSEHRNWVGEHFEAHSNSEGEP